MFRSKTICDKTEIIVQTVTNVNMTLLLITILFLIYNKDLIKKYFNFAQIFQHIFTNLSKMIWREKFSPIHNLEHNGLVNTFYFIMVL